MSTLHEAATKALAVLDSFALHLPEILSGPDYETTTELRSALKRSAQQAENCASMIGETKAQCARKVFQAMLDTELTNYTEIIE